MFSYLKKADKELLLEIGKMIRTLAKLGHLELAEKYGQTYLDLDLKIKSGDYRN